MCYYNGQGVDKNINKAVEYYEKAAEQGFAEAQNNLATQYKRGYGVKKNEKKAAYWYRRAAEQGHLVAQGLFWSFYIKDFQIEKEIDQNFAIKLCQNRAKKKNQTSLRMAISSKNLELARLFIEMDEKNLGARNSEGLTLFLKILINSIKNTDSYNIKILEMLLKKRPESINDRDPLGQGVLELFINNFRNDNRDNLEVFNFLIKESKIDLLEKEGNELVELATIYNSKGIIKFLKQKRISLQEEQKHRNNVEKYKDYIGLSNYNQYLSLAELKEENEREPSEDNNFILLIRKMKHNFSSEKFLYFYQPILDILVSSLYGEINYKRIVVIENAVPILKKHQLKLKVAQMLEYMLEEETVLEEEEPVLIRILEQEALILKQEESILEPALMRILEQKALELESLVFTLKKDEPILRVILESMLKLMSEHMLKLMSERTPEPMPKYISDDKLEQLLKREKHMLRRTLKSILRECCGRLRKVYNA